MIFTVFPDGFIKWRIGIKIFFDFFVVNVKNFVGNLIKKIAVVRMMTYDGSFKSWRASIRISFDSISRWFVGSSMIRRLFDLISSFAKATRAFSPPESTWIRLKTSSPSNTNLPQTFSHADAKLPVLHSILLHKSRCPDSVHPTDAVRNIRWLRLNRFSTHLISRLSSQKHFNQRWFTRTVQTCKSNFFSAFNSQNWHCQKEVCHQSLFFQVFYINHNPSASRWRRKTKLDRLFFGSQSRSSRFCPSALPVTEPVLLLKLCNGNVQQNGLTEPVSPVGWHIGRVKFLRVLLFLLLYHRIISGYLGQFSEFNFKNTFNQIIKKITVVRNHNQRTVIIFQISFQPFHRFQIKVIGRLIQKQIIRFGRSNLARAIRILHPPEKFLTGWSSSFTRSST